MTGCRLAPPIWSNTEPMMSTANELDRKITFSLHHDESIVLYRFLSREIWQHDEARLRSAYENPAESHSLQALLQELVSPLMDTGGADADQIYAAAANHLLRRHS
jgi:hypothetical protein